MVACKDYKKKKLRLFSAKDKILFYKRPFGPRTSIMIFIGASCKPYSLELGKQQCTYFLSVQAAALIFRRQAHHITIEKKRCVCGGRLKLAA